ncbi:MAG: hypothetical protein AAF797_13995 [Planctomycetota bacterium]
MARLKKNKLWHERLKKVTNQTLALIEELEEKLRTDISQSQKSTIEAIVDHLSNALDSIDENFDDWDDFNSYIFAIYRGLSFKEVGLSSSWIESYGQVVIEFQVLQGPWRMASD